MTPILDDSFFYSWQEFCKYLKSEGEYHVSYDLHNAIDFKNETFGLIFVQNEYFFAKIIVDRGVYCLEQSELDTSTCLYKVLGVSGDKMHLFVN